MRIVSLVPSATEIVCALGLSRQLVGVTHECDYPIEAAGKLVVTRPVVDLRGATDAAIDKRVGAAAASGTPIFAVDEDAIRRLKPDLIITQALCAVCAPSGASVAEMARDIEPAITVLSLEPSSLEGIFNTISTIGAMTETEHKAMALLGRLRGRLGRIEQKVAKSRKAGHRRLRVVGLEWLDPPMVLGHWVPEQIRRAGGWDLLGREGERSVRTTWDAIAGGRAGHAPAHALWLRPRRDGARVRADAPAAVLERDHGRPAPERHRPRRLGLLQPARARGSSTASRCSPRSSIPTGSSTSPRR